MIITQQNRLLPILAGIVLLLLVLVLSKSCGTETDDSVLLEKVPMAAAPDADSPADTIKTLTANVAAMTSELKSLRQLNATLRSDNEKLAGQREDIEARVSSRLDQEFAAREKQLGERSDALNALDKRINALSELVTSAAANAGGNDMPIGLGLDGGGSPGDWVWVEPLDANGQHFGDALLQRTGRIARPGTAADIESGVATDRGNAATPVYTVPRNATLMGSTAMTALLGRIPKRGEVRDPMPFKVITGRDNLAANGLTIPGVEGMIWSGTAIGDWTLSCVTGRLESVTFVFDDGHIRTVSSDDREQRGNDANRPLGWISDAQGIPCISGDRKSNAGAFLSQRIGVKAIEAAAEAAAASQTTTVVRDSGISHSVDGDTAQFVLGKTAASGSEEIAQWLLERQAQSFDAVFVPAGAEVALHVDRELTIDLMPNGRRLNHANTNSTRSDSLD